MDSNVAIAVAVAVAQARCTMFREHRDVRKMFKGL